MQDVLFFHLLLLERFKIITHAVKVSTSVVFGTRACANVTDRDQVHFFLKVDVAAVIDGFANKTMVNMKNQIVSVVVIPRW